MLSEDRKMPTTFEPVTIVVETQGQHLDPLRPERLPGSTCRARDAEETGIHPG